MFHVKHWKGDKDMAIDYNRQYVGARYVPQFFNNPNGSWDWAQGFQYEPLTMVKYGTNTYTSKQLVPSTVGAPNLNTEYWAQTGDYNGSIVAIQQQLDSLEQNVTYPTFFRSNRVFLVIGDSYANENASAVKFPTYARKSLQIATENWINVAVGSSGFIGEGGTKFLAQLQSQVAMANRDRITDILIVGGLNDSIGDDISLINAMQEFQTFAFENYPKAMIHLGFAGSYLSTSTAIGNRTIQNILACEGIYEGNGRILGWDVLSGLRKSWARGTFWYLSDGVHPSYDATESSATGQYLLGVAVANMLSGMPNIVQDRNRKQDNILMNYRYDDSSVELWTSNGYCELFPGKELTNQMQTIATLEFTTFLSPYIVAGTFNISHTSGTDPHLIEVLFTGNTIQARLPQSDISDAVNIIYLPALSIPRNYVS